ncbi:MAG TPA: response regulator [Bryobacteraceae bacterium]|nr:response regulator [Bryobacteraceae bacterium]
MRTEVVPSDHKSYIRQLTVLMIEAHHPDQRLMKEALESIDRLCVCVGVTKTDEALAYIRDGGLVDLIVLTLNTDRDGLESISLLRDESNSHAMPVAVFAGGSGPDEANLVWNAGASLYLDKPFNFDGYLRLASELIKYLENPFRPADIRPTSSVKRRLQ